ncbi:carbonic anhydrase [Salinibius halmophilus]|uniref:carbonic anhydrase n=1 Tax=Salinibius halmophilus TaxID=1853216 RepID=UPI000E66FECB|nr:carbonic anhydrase family protein [Salinibius halmophilus]
MKKLLLSATLGTATLLTTLTAQAAEWGYHGDHSPEHWGEQFEACNGAKQSPVNLADFVDGNLPAIQFDYQVAGEQVINNGHTVQVNFAPGNAIEVAGTTFELKQFHFHSPSENTLAGRLFPMEAHLVHASAEGELAVIGVFFDFGDANPAIAKAWAQMPEEDGKATLVIGAMADALLPESRDYYAFDGSLTTPPCSEGVNWMVMKDTLTVSEAQVKQLLAAMGGHNNRPVQPLNGRVVSQ